MLLKKLPRIAIWLIAMALAVGIVEASDKDGIEDYIEDYLRIYTTRRECSPILKNSRIRFREYKKMKRIYGNKTKGE